jgi:hypothetical protein
MRSWKLNAHSFDIKSPANQSSRFAFHFSVAREVHIVCIIQKNNLVRFYKLSKKQQNPARLFPMLVSEQ